MSFVGTGFVGKCSYPENGMSSNLSILYPRLKVEITTCGDLGILNSQSLKMFSCKTKVKLLIVSSLPSLYDLVFRVYGIYGSITS